MGLKKAKKVDVLAFLVGSPGRRWVLDSFNVLEFFETTGPGPDGVPDDLPKGTVVAVGGDGTVHAVLNRIDKGEHVLGILPCGSDNGAAASFGIKTINDCMLPPHPTDAMEVRTTDKSVWDLHAVCWGGAAYMNKLAETTLRWMGPLKGIVAPLVAIYRNEPTYGDVLLTGDDGVKTFKGPFSTVVVTNLPRASASMVLAPAARPDDGAVHVIMIPHTTRWRLLKAFWDMHRDRQPHQVHAATYVRLTTTTGDVDVSGEPFASGRNTVEIFARKQSVQVARPVDSVTEA
jgi:diacylglycerol kinase family enzyme